MNGRNAVTVLECCATSLRAGKKVIMLASQEQALKIDDLSLGQSEECSNFFLLTVLLWFYSYFIFLSAVLALCFFLCYDVHLCYYYSDAYHLGDMHADLLLWLDFLSSLSSNFRPPFWRLNALCHHATAEWAARQPSSRSSSHNGPHSPGNEWRRGGSKFNAQSCKGCNGWVDHDQGSEMLEIYLLTQRIVTKSTKQLQLYYCCLIDILRNV